MAKSDDTGKGCKCPEPSASIVNFPQSRVSPPGAGTPFKELGVGRMALVLGHSREQTTGHWCSFCKGIWYGYMFEVECPVCRSRDG